MKTELKSSLPLALKQEVWKWIRGYEKYYEISSFGRVRSYVITGPLGVSLVVQRILSQHSKSRDYPNGYLKVSLHKEGKVREFTIHSLVLEAFIGERPEGKIGCHSDGDKRNNKLFNLYWGTGLTNSLDAIRHKTGQACKLRKDLGLGLTVENEIKLIRFWADKGIKTEYLAEFFMVSRGAIRKIITGKTWEHIK